jgi:hypothetical protein
MALRIFKALALLSSFIGIATMAFVLFGPFYKGVSSTGTEEYASLLMSDPQPLAIVASILIILTFISMGGGALLTHASQAIVGKVVFWIATGFFAVFIVLTLPSIGLFLTPSLGLALLALPFSFVQSHMSGNSQMRL